MAVSIYQGKTLIRRIWVDKAVTAGEGTPLQDLVLAMAYHKAGKQALGKPARSAVHRDYIALKKARNAAGRKLGKLTGVRK